MERSLGVRKGTWCKEEDDLLKESVQKYGEGKWHLIPQRAGLKRCRKSCRLRWLNYLKPDIKRGDFTRDEVDLMVKLHSLLGNRWSLIAARLPGRTANDVKNYWNYKIRKKGASHTQSCSEITMKTQYTYEVIKPRPFTFSGNSSWLRTGKPKIAVIEQDTTTTDAANEECSIKIASPQQQLESSMEEWWENLVDDFEKGSGEEGNSSSSMSDYNREGKLDDQLWDIQELRWNDFPLRANLCDLPS